MKIVVDNGLKKKVQVENRKNRSGIRNLWLFEKVLLAVVIAFIVIFPIYCRKTGYLISTITRTGEKSYFIVAMLTSCIAGAGMTLVLLVSVLRKRIESVIIGERVDETIEIIDDKLFYTFRIKYQTLVEQRNIIILDLSKIKSIQYDEKLSEINIEGMMVEKIVDRPIDVHKIKISEMTNSKLKLWDYFIPSLYELLKSKQKRIGFDKRNET